MSTAPHHLHWMRQAIAEAERARGKTGDNPWVGCVIVSAEGLAVGRGHTQGPGEDHAEVGALREARGAGAALPACTLYSTLEPCSFHGRTPSCARGIVSHGVGTVVIAMRDPNPRVDGLGIQILRDGGVQVIDGVCEAEVRQQLGAWVLRFHPHEVIRRASALLARGDEATTARALAEAYAVPLAEAERVVADVLMRGG
jgi:diaminohydroxyphosphoribosylaminopyrimidine deaminase/5-amino-6-(5-phosphoribosylamino)uracil reductase